MLKAYQGHAKFLEEIRNTKVEVDQWQLEKLALTGIEHELLFYTPGAAKQELGYLARQAFSDLDEAIAALVSGLPSRARIVLLPEGPYTYARALPALV